MKKIIFLVHFSNIKKSSGILEKIINQSKSMYNNDILYKTFILYKALEKNDIKKFESNDFIEFVPLDFYKNTKSKIKKVIMLNKVYKQYDKICEKEKNNYDCIYMRYNILHFSFIKFIKKYKNKIIFEHNSIELAEYKANKNMLYFLQEKSLGKTVRLMSKGYVCVSNEIYDYQNKNYINKKGIVISNGVNVKSFDMRKVPKYNKKVLNMIFVGNIRYWHGLERIISSIENYNGSIKIIFNIAGEFNQDDYLSSLISKNKTKNEINMIGYKNKKELNQYFDQAHIAIGCLGGYKKNIDHGSVLKNREYFSRGIPIIYSEIDDDISINDNIGLFMQVPNNDSELKMDDIIKFVENYYKDPINNTKKIRLFAEQNLDYEKKINKMKEYLYELN